MNFNLLILLSLIFFTILPFIHIFWIQDGENSLIWMDIEFDILMPFLHVASIMESSS